MRSLFILLSYITLFAQNRFYDKPIVLEASATIIDIQNIHKFRIEPLIVDDIGKIIKIKVIEHSELDYEALEEEMDIWRVRNKYWGNQESMEYLQSIIREVI